MVADGRSGVLAAPRDPAAFARAVRDLLEVPQRRQAMGEAAARFVSRSAASGGPPPSCSAALAAADAIRAMRR